MTSGELLVGEQLPPTVELATALSSVTEAARKLVATASDHGLGKSDLIRIIKELS